MMVFLCLCSNGCSYKKDITHDDPFRRLYEMKGTLKNQKNSVIGKEFPDITLSCFKMPLSVFVRVLSDKYSLGLVYSESLSDKTITAEFKESDLLSVLNVVSRQLSVDIVRVGNTFFIGSLRPEDRGILVRKVLGQDSASLSQVCQSMISSNGKVSVTADCVVVATDHESVIRRFSEMLDYLDTVESDTWIVQLCFVVLRKDALIEAGMDTTTSGTLSYNISENTFDLKDFKIDGLISVLNTSNFADIYSSPMLLCRDGQVSKWQDGRRVPIPKKVVSDYGTVTTTGFDYVDTGFSVDCSVKQSRIGGRLNLKIEMSDIKSYVEYAPVTTQSVYQIDVDLVPDKAYLLGELSTFKILDTTKNLGFLSQDKGKSVIQLWGQIYRIKGNLQAQVPTFFKSDPVLK